MFVIKPSTMDVLDLTPSIEGYEPGHHLRFLRPPPVNEP